MCLWTITDLTEFDRSARHLSCKLSKEKIKCPFLEWWSSMESLSKSGVGIVFSWGKLKNHGLVH